MAKAENLMRRVVTGLLLLSLAACTPIFRNHGYAPTDDELAEVQVGVDTRETVGTLIGRPTAAGLLQDSGWFYVQSRYRHYAYRAPVEIDRQVVSISFDQRGVVQNVERFGLEDGQVVALSRRVTETNIRGVSFIRQLMGNLGNLRADQFLKK